jgi:hypothetical protein
MELHAIPDLVIVVSQRVGRTLGRDANRVLRSISGRAVRLSPSRWRRSKRKNTSDPSSVSLAF